MIILSAAFDYYNKETKTRKDENYKIYINYENYKNNNSNKINKHIISQWNLFTNC